MNPSLCTDISRLRSSIITFCRIALKKEEYHQTNPGNRINNLLRNEMKQFNIGIVRQLVVLPALFAGSLIPTLAGVIPHYSLSADDAEFLYLENGTAIPHEFDGGNKVIFSDGTATSKAYEGEGFPIGFKFRYAGRIFDTFALTSNGTIILGNNGKVGFDGGTSFYSSAYGATGTPFYFGCVPVRYAVGDKNAKISYKLEGEEGKRTLTIEFRSLKLKEIGTQGNGIYSTQIRLYEADGRIDMILHEEETAYSNAGFIVGLCGWDSDDIVLGKAKGISGEFTKSPLKSASQLNSDTYVTWDPTDFMVMKTRCYTFLPAADEAAPECKPSSIDVKEIGTELEVTVVKGDEAAGTLLLMSEKPFGDTEIPTDGVSYPGNNVKSEDAIIGNAIVLCHTEEHAKTISIPDIESGKTYYFRAISTNGYPRYSENHIDHEFVSSQPAPHSLTAAEDSENDGMVTLECKADSHVLIAMTNVPYPYYLEENPYRGDFGMPNGDAAEGDVIEGGGKVIYIGAPGKITVPLPEQNRPVYYRAWSIADGRISATSLDTYVVPATTIPYDPAIETWPISCTPEGWTAKGGSVTPDQRSAEPYQAILLNAGSAEPTIFTSPELPMSGDMKITFLWSLESQEKVDAAPTQKGLFGPDGYASLAVGFEGEETECWRVTEYTGKMEVKEAGNAEMLPETIIVKDTRPGMHLRFEVLTEENYFGRFFLSGLMVEEYNFTSASSIESSPELSVASITGGIILESASDTLVTIFSIDGRRISKINLKAGEAVRVELDKGIYTAGGLKIIVR